MSVKLLMQARPSPTTSRRKSETENGSRVLGLPRGSFIRRKYAKTLVAPSFRLLSRSDFRPFGRRRSSFLAVHFPRS
jgi:hypothetical protein